MASKSSKFQKIKTKERAIHNCSYNQILFVLSHKIIGRCMIVWGVNKKIINFKILKE